MQFIEENMFGVRSAVYELYHRDTGLAFLLIPMIHVAEPSFYHEVHDRVLGCDSVVLEGVDSISGSRLALSYRIFGYWNRIGLVEQNDAEILTGFSGKVLHGDVGGGEFDSSWSSVSLRMRLLLAVMAPVIGIHRMFFNSRKRIARGLRVEDLRSRKRLLQSEDADSISHVIVDQRDKYLVDFLRKYIQGHDGASERIAVIWGASHIPSVAHFLLTECGYRIEEAAWISVFGFNNA